jgi:hypothetical protein
MSYRILVALVVGTLLGNCFYVSACNKSLGICDINQGLGIYMIVDSVLLVLILLTWAVFRIQKARHPENFIGPADNENLKQEMKQYGDYLGMAKQVIDKDKDLLVDLNNIKPDKPAEVSNNRFSQSLMLFVVVALLVFGAVALKLYTIYNRIQADNIQSPKIDTIQDIPPLPKGYTLDDYKIEKVLEIACQKASECETPGEYLVQSRCPFTSLCLENKCTVVCPGSNQEKCGIENCHGLDIHCGPNIPASCDAMYGLGDKCRQYAQCEIRNGACQLVGNENFSACKSCVDECQNKFKDDLPSAFSCESKCE